MIRRREFIAGVGAASLVPMATRAQQKTLPVVGFLHVTAQNPYTDTLVAALKKGLGETGVVEGRQVAFEYRYANNQLDQIPALAADLVSQRVAVIVASGGSPSIAAAEVATKSIPIVFIDGGDPVRDKFVPNLNRPGGNVTGATFFAANLQGKRLELLRGLVPGATKIGEMFDSGVGSKNDLTAVPGVQLFSIDTRSGIDIEAAFAQFVQEGVGALLVEASPFLNGQGEKIVALAKRYGIPTSYALNQHVELGGLMSYGTSNLDAYRQAGTYVSKILNGAKPGDLPVLQPTVFELVINLKTAKALGLTVPQSLLVAADQVIE